MSSTGAVAVAASRETRDGWLLLTEPGAAERNTRAASMRHTVAQLVLAILVVLVVLGLVGALVSRRLAEQQVVHQATQITDILAESAVQPALTDDLAVHPTAAGAMNSAVRSGVLGTSVVRVKLWDRSGRIVYSDEARLVGQRYGLDDEARESFADHATQADVSNLAAPENRYERGLGKLLEVYRPVWTPNGTPLLFEAYYRYDTVTARSSDLWRAFIGIMLSSLAAVVVLLIPVAWGLVQRARRAQRQRESAMRRAVEAELEERRRIAGTRRRPPCARRWPGCARCWSSCIRRACAAAAWWPRSAICPAPSRAPMPRSSSTSTSSWRNTCPRRSRGRSIASPRKACATR